MFRSAVVAAAFLAGACAGAVHAGRADTQAGVFVRPAACRAATTPDGSTAAPRQNVQDVHWIHAEAADDRIRLDDWCRGVGPAVVSDTAAIAGRLPRLEDVSVVSWNVEVGGGDLDALLDRVGIDRGPPVVILVQEAYREGALVPPTAEEASAPGRIAPSPPSGARRSVIETASRRGLSVFYVPSMRNGRGDPREDRGNAILSTLPLSDLTAIELPFEHQRRVAVAASVRVADADGQESVLSVICAHLDVQASWRHGRFLWLGRARQAQALLAAVDGMPDPKILGGDFNTWLGDAEPALREARSRFPETPAPDAHVTFPVIGGLGFHLDHLFFRLPAGWNASVSRIDDRWGSDHHPLVASLIPGT
jgi:endonuclease/exonuclease/phosphatase family metal-dependent hydrolase